MLVNALEVHSGAFTSDRTKVLDRSVALHAKGQVLTGRLGAARVGPIHLCSFTALAPQIFGSDLPLAGQPAGGTSDHVCVCQELCGARKRINAR